MPAPSATSRIGTGVSPPRRARSTSAATAAWLLSLTVITPGKPPNPSGIAGRLAEPRLLVVIRVEERRCRAIAGEDRPVQGAPLRAPRKGELERVDPCVEVPDHELVPDLVRVEDHAGPLAAGDHV